MGPWPSARRMNSPSDPNRFLNPPHLVSMVTVSALASHEPFGTNQAWPGWTSMTLRSPGRNAATSIQPPSGGAV